MNWKLFLDDERDPIGTDWVVCRCVTEAVIACENYGMPNFISFDHDLGQGFSPENYDNTGLGFVKWLIDQCLDEKLKFPTDFDFYVHSQNPIGKANIENLMNNFLSKSDGE